MTIQYQEIAPVLSGNLKSEQHNAITRCLAFNEAVTKGFTAKSSAAAAHVAKDLEFGESTVEAIAKGELQFNAADPATPFVGNWTTGTLNLLIQEVGSSMDANTLLSLEFPDKPVPEYMVILDRIAANTGIMPEFGGGNAMLPTSRPLDTYGVQYQPGLWASRTSLGSKDITNARKRGTGNFGERGIGQLMAYNAVNLAVTALTRKKFLLSQAVFNNGFTYGGMTINSNIPAQNYIALESMGTLNANGSVTYATSDPTYSPIAAITNVLGNPLFLKYRNLIRGIIVNAQDLQAIMNHPNVKAVSNILAAGSTSAGTRSLSLQIGEVTKEIGAYYAPGFDIPLLGDGDVWVSQNADGTTKTTPNDATNLASAQNFIIPRGSMKVLLDLPSVNGLSGAFHLTCNEVDPNNSNPAMGLFFGAFARNLSNSDNVNRVDLVGALAGAPAIYMPEAQIILNGLYTNV